MASSLGHAQPSARPTRFSPQAHTALMARVLASLFAAGATLAMFTVALPHSARMNTLGLLLIVADAYLFAVVLAGRATSMPRWVLPPALACGSTAIAGVAYFSANSPSPLIFFFQWVFIYCAYFFTPRESAVQIVYAGALYGLLLALRHPPGGIIQWWIVYMATLAVAWAVIRLMRSRGEGLVATARGRRAHRFADGAREPQRLP